MDRETGSYFSRTPLICCIFARTGQVTTLVRKNKMAQHHAHILMHSDVLNSCSSETVCVCFYVWFLVLQAEIRTRKVSERDNALRSTKK